MIVLEAGKSYELSDGSIISFRTAERPSGVTTEELLQVLRHRVGTQGQVVPGRHTKDFIYMMDKAMACLRVRENARQATGTLGTDVIHDPIIADPQ